MVDKQKVEQAIRLLLEGIGDSRQNCTYVRGNLRWS